MKSQSMPVQTSPEQVDAGFIIDLVTTKLPLVQAIFVATELNISDYVKEKSCSIKELAQKTGCVEDNLYRLLRVLSSFGIFCEEEEGYFSNTRTSLLLSKDTPGSLRDIVLWDAGLLTWRSLEGLRESVTSGACSFEHIFGMPFFEYLETHPPYKKRLYNALNKFGQIVIPSFMRHYSFSSFKKVVDVGGGDGELISFIHKAYPNIDCALYERNEIVSQLDGSKLSEIDIFEGDFFRNRLPKADCYIFKLIFHDWNDEKCIEILKNCENSITQEGRLLIAEPVLIRGSETERFSTMLDFDMMLLTGGKERTPEEFQVLLNIAGFEIDKIIATDSPIYIIEASRINKEE